jgi:hypothetical protein
MARKPKNETIQDILDRIEEDLISIRDKADAFEDHDCDSDDDFEEDDSDESDDDSDEE